MWRVAKTIYIIVFIALLFWYMRSPGTCFVSLDWIMRAIGLPAVILTLSRIIAGKLPSVKTVYQGDVLFSKHPFNFAILGGLQLTMGLILSVGFSFLHYYSSIAIKLLAATIISLTVLSYLIAFVSMRFNMQTNNQPLPEQNIEPESKRISASKVSMIILLICFLFLVGATKIEVYFRNFFRPAAKAIYQAHSYEKQDQYKDAIGQLNKVIRLEPKNRRAYNDRGFDYQKLGQYQKAIDDYTKAVELGPKWALAYSNRSMAFIHLKQYQNAIDDSSKAINISSKFFGAYINRGIAYMGLKQYQKAIDDESMALQLLKQSPKPGVYINRGNAYCELKQYQEAVDDFSKAIELDPQSADAYQNRGQAYEKLGQHEAAKKDLTQAKRLGYKSESENINFLDIYH